MTIAGKYLFSLVVPFDLRGIRFTDSELVCFQPVIECGFAEYWVFRDQQIRHQSIHFFGCEDHIADEETQELSRQQRDARWDGDQWSSGANLFAYQLH